MVYHLNSECALGLLERGAWEQSLNVTCTEAAGSSVSYLPLWLQPHNGSVRFHLRLSEMWIFIFLYRLLSVFVGLWAGAQGSE